MPVIQPVILSGGSGSRLWPASREAYPKQLLPLYGRHTMLQATASRLRDKANAGNDAIVVCNEAHRFFVAEQLRAIGRRASIVLEPVGRSTAPAALLAALLALRDGADEDPPLLLIMPADHVIEDQDAFLGAVEAGEAAAADGKLVMFGVLPSSPHTEYGYIEAESAESGATPVRSFVEKPDRKTAVALLETNRYYWNSGIFLFRADSFVEELEAFEPDMVAACRDSLGRATTDADFVRPDADAFEACPSNSIDYALMEKTARGVMVPMTAGWSDVGSWSALYDVSGKDESGNVVAGDVIARHCEGSYLSSSHRLVAAVGLRDLIVVEDGDAVLVADRDSAQEVKSIVDTLLAADRHEPRRHRRVRMPWGSADDIDSGDEFCIRRLVIDPGAAIELTEAPPASRQWFILRGDARVTVDDVTSELTVGESVPAGCLQRVKNTAAVPLQLLEVRFGEDRSN